ncbi:bifunctional RNase H/acid phosphatase [Nocardioides flavescens]|uniref:Bifunctional RNase H/acid phosphatase n=1 Tax=Nocardioides flavescens TaxID=2691959 RepID=A0A6L7F4Q0_9ACTN|nr:bifunctional RNase H/acid phosphatase [Nocardioides flavescens]
MTGPTSAVGSVVGSVVIEADGGSRGNPGPAAYGAVLKDADTGRVLAEDGTRIGTATNNVAEYSGLIAGLRLAAEFAPAARVEVRMDSKLVVEQMAGRWQVKHPSMKPLHREASELAPAGTRWTWVPRAQNAHADRLANEALDGKRDGVTAADARDPGPAEDDSAVEAATEKPPARGWSASTEPPTTLVLVRHGVTVHTKAKRFSGGLGGDDPALSEEGRAQVRASAHWLAPIAASVAAVVASPVRRTRESAEIVAETLGRPLELEPGFAEMEFGRWDGLTFAEVAERDQAGLDAWLGSTDVAPPGGESFATVQERVLAGLERVRAAYAGRTVVVVSHVTPIKTLVAQALDAPLTSVFRMELTPASVSVVSWYADDRASLRLFNAKPPGDDAFGASGLW